MSVRLNAPSLPTSSVRSLTNPSHICVRINTRANGRSTLSRDFTKSSSLNFFVSKIYILVIILENAVMKRKNATRICKSESQCFSDIADERSSSIDAILSTLRFPFPSLRDIPKLSLNTRLRRITFFPSASMLSWRLMSVCSIVPSSNAKFSIGLSGSQSGNKWSFGCNNTEHGRPIASLIALFRERFSFELTSSSLSPPISMFNASNCLMSFEPSCCGRTVCLPFCRSIHRPFLTAYYVSH